MNRQALSMIDREPGAPLREVGGVLLVVDGNLDVPLVFAFANMDGFVVLYQFPHKTSNLVERAVFLRFEDVFVCHGPKLAYPLYKHSCGDGNTATRTSYFQSNNRNDYN